MNSKETIINTITAQGIVPLFYHDDTETSLAVLKALYRSGVRVVEYTCRGSQAGQNFKVLIEDRNQNMPDLYLGIGSIKNVQQAKEFLDMQADFFISPGFIPEVASFLVEKSILYVPGCMTPSEIICAENAGVEMIKLFPGNCIGPDFLLSIKNLFPKLKFMPTGGVTTNEENLTAWFRAGVSAVGIGSQLISSDLMIRKDFTVLEQETRNVLETIHTIKINK